MRCYHSVTKLRPYMPATRGVATIGRKLGQEKSLNSCIQSPHSRPLTRLSFARCSSVAGQSSPHLFPNASLRAVGCLSWLMTARGILLLAYIGQGISPLAGMGLLVTLQVDISLCGAGGCKPPKNTSHPSQHPFTYLYIISTQSLQPSLICLQFHPHIFIFSLPKTSITLDFLTFSTFSYFL
jgi:hypothetical protein